jgi:hypothetical protein
MGNDKVKNLIDKLESSGLEKAKENLRYGRYSSWKVPHVEDWIKKKERLKIAPTFMYHEIKAPKGKIFKAHEVARLKNQGWRESPAEFGKGVRGKWYSFISLCTGAIGFYKKHWKVTVPLTITIIIAIISFAIQLFIHFDSESVTDATKDEIVNNSNSSTK